MKTSAKPLRVALLTNFVSPYRLPMYQALGSTPGWQLKVITNAATEFDRNWSVDASALEAIETRTWTRLKTIRHGAPVPYEEEVSQHVPVGLFGDLWRARPDAVITGELGPRSLIAIAYGLIRRVPVVIWSYHSRTSMQGGRLSLWVKRFLLRRATAVVGMGSQAREVLENLSVPPSKIHDAWNAADSGSIAERLLEPEHKQAVQRIRNDHGNDRKIALVVGRLIPMKGIQETIAAWLKLPQALRDQWTLVFLGDGPLQVLLDENKDSSIQHVGFVKPQHVTDWLAAADLHVFASLGDVWGLVVNEAMACGTPTLCSIHAGCSDDLVEAGVSGLVFDPADPNSSAEALAAALARTDLPSLGARAYIESQSCTSERFADGFRRAIAHAVPPERRGLCTPTIPPPFVNS